MINGIDELLTALNSKIIELKETIELLKNCENCKHSLTMSQIDKTIHDDRPCKGCHNESLWVMIDHE